MADHAPSDSEAAPHAGAWTADPPAARAQPYTPPFDISRTETDLFVRIDLPGVVEDDIELSVEGRNRLVLRGVRRRELKLSRERYIAMSRPAGRFELVLPLPVSAWLEPRVIRAGFDRGVLVIVVPAPRAPRPAIAVRTGDAAIDALLT